MEALEGGHRGDFLVDFRVVLHRATAQRVEAGVHSEVHLGEICVVSDDVGFAHLGKDGILSSEQACRNIFQRTLAKATDTEVKSMMTTSMNAVILFKCFTSH